MENKEYNQAYGMNVSDNYGNGYSPKLMKRNVFTGLATLILCLTGCGGELSLGEKSLSPKIVSDPINELVGGDIGSPRRPFEEQEPTESAEEVTERLEVFE